MTPPRYDRVGVAVYRAKPPHNPLGKIDASLMTSFSHHRCGWPYAIEALAPEHNDGGVWLDGFVEVTFKRAAARPYLRPWVGFVHFTPRVPDWFPSAATAGDLVRTEAFRDSLPHCRGLFTLSRHLADHLRGLAGVPVSPLLFPTATPAVTFDADAFESNPEKKVVAVGSWMRRMTSIYHLPLDAAGPYRKWQLGTDAAGLAGMQRAMARLEFVREAAARGPLPAAYGENTRVVDRLSDEAYDELLSRNVVFLDLFDASANNAVVECMARATPLLVNPIPAVVEYLGEGYPLYYGSLAEAAAKACDFGLVRRAHEYLRDCPNRGRLTQECFLREFRESEVYRGL